MRNWNNQNGPVADVESRPVVSSSDGGGVSPRSGRVPVAEESGLRFDDAVLWDSELRFAVGGGKMKPQSSLPTDPAARKEAPIASGFFDYFPDAIVAVARLSFKANARHNPNEDLHWSKHKSTDHADCLQRHFLQRGEWDEEWQESHTVEMAWRAMAYLQMEIEAKRAGLTMKEYIAKLKKDAENASC